MHGHALLDEIGAEPALFYAISHHKDEHAEITPAHAIGNASSVDEGRMEGAHNCWVCKDDNSACVNVGAVTVENGSCSAIMLLGIGEWFIGFIVYFYEVKVLLKQKQTI